VRVLIEYEDRRNVTDVGSAYQSDACADPHRRMS
jgi:hypothetical protein